MQIDNRLDQVIDMSVVEDGDGDPRGEVRVVLTFSQAAKLAELLNRHVDLDVVSLDNDDVEGALFVRQFLTTWAEASA